MQKHYQIFHSIVMELASYFIAKNVRGNQFSRSFLQLFSLPTRPSLYSRAQRERDWLAKRTKAKDSSEQNRILACTAKLLVQHKENSMTN